MRRLAIAALFGACLATPAHADRALIVGIDVYKESALSFQLPNASFNDSERMHKLLTGVLGYKESEIRILRNEEATHDAIMDGLKTWLAETKPGERAFFYFVGHGHYQPDTNGDEEDKLDETLVPYDAVIKRTESSVSLENMVVDDEIGAALDELKGRHVTAVLDSCHSGTVTRAIGSGPNNAARTPQLRQLTRSITADVSAQRQKQSGRSADSVSDDVGLVTWTAVSPSQLALIDEDAAPNYRGLFTASFADGIEKGLADKNANGVISNQELLDFVRSRAEDYCKRRPERCEMGVTPMMEGLGAATRAAAPNPVLVASAAVGKAAGEPAKEKVAEAVTDPKAAQDKIDPALLKVAIDAANEAPKAEGVNAEAIATAVAGSDTSGDAAAVEVAVKTALADATETAEASVPKDGALNKGKVTPEKIMDMLGASLVDDVKIEQIPPSPIKLGTKNIRFRVTSPKDGFLILLSVSDEGEVVQLFPTEHSSKNNKDGKILANSPITVPDKSYGIRFDATSVTSGTVMALVAVDPLKLSREFVSRKIEVIPQDTVNDKVLPELAESLATPAAKETPTENTKPVGRGVATVRYEITE